HKCEASVRGGHSPDNNRGPLCLCMKHMGHNRHVLSTMTSTGKTRTRDGQQPPGPLEVQWNPRNQSPDGHPGGGSSSSASSCPHSPSPASQRPLRWRRPGVRQRTPPRASKSANHCCAGNGTSDEKPLEGVRITVEGNGYDAETKTDAEGKWRLG